MKKVLKYFGFVAVGLLLIGLLLLLTPAITGKVAGSVHIELESAVNGFVMTFGGKGAIVDGLTGFKSDAKPMGEAITAFVFLMVSVALGAFIGVNNMLKKPLVKLPFPAFWCGLFVTSLVAAILFFVAQGRLAENYDLGPAFVLAAVMCIVTCLVAAFRVAVKFLKKD